MRNRGPCWGSRLRHLSFQVFSFLHLCLMYRKSHENHVGPCSMKGVSQHQLCAKKTPPELVVGNQLVSLGNFSKAFFLGGGTYLGVGFKHFLFSSRKLGKIPILTNIFQRGWFNHQLVTLVGRTVQKRKKKKAFPPKKKHTHPEGGCG